MGTSYTEYRELGFWSRDDTVELWLYLLVTVLDEHADLPSWLREARDHWQLQSGAGLLGCVSANLDEYLANDPTRERILLVVLDELRTRLAAYHGVIPAHVATAFEVGGGKRFHDVHTGILFRFTDAVAGLIHGEHAWDTSGRVPVVFQL